jgi:hypothetical protein
MDTVSDGRIAVDKILVVSSFHSRAERRHPARLPAAENRRHSGIPPSREDCCCIARLDRQGYREREAKLRTERQQREASSAASEDGAAAARSLKRRLDAPAPTLSEFLRHAELYGTDQVYETAQAFLAESELVQLALELNRIDGKPTGRRFSGKPTRRKRLSREQRIQGAEFLRAEGVPNSRIATHLGVSERRVEQLFQEARKLRRAARKAPEPEIFAPDGAGAA